MNSEKDPSKRAREREKRFEGFGWILPLVFGFVEIAEVGYIESKKDTPFVCALNLIGSLLQN